MESTFEQTNDENIQKRYDTLVISGGHMNCIYALGVLDCFDEYLSDISTFIGTSAGSILCYLLCIGYSPKEILAFVITHYEIIDKLSLNAKNILNNDIISKGIFSGTGFYNYNIIQELLEKMTIDKIGKYLTIGDINTMFHKKITFTTFNMTSQKTEYLSIDNYPELPCLTAIRMSCNIPFLFPHFKYMNCFYIDGAISNNFPIEYGESIGEKVLGINITPPPCSKYPTNTIEDIKILLEIIIRKKYIEKNELRDNTLVVNISPTQTINDTNVTLLLDSFSEGYKQGRQYI